VADAVEEIGRPEHGVGHLELLEHAPRRRLLFAAIDDREPFGVAEPRGMPAQDPYAQRMDRGDLRLGGRGPPATEQRAGPGENLAGRLVGERHGQNPRRIGPSSHEVGDPGDDDAGLARARAGEHEERTGRREHGVALGGIEAREQLGISG